MILQIRLSVGMLKNGSIVPVVASGTRSMSLSWISWKPRMLEPSKPVPSTNKLGLSSPSGSVTCWNVPGTSVNFRSTIWMPLSWQNLITSSGLVNPGNSPGVVIPVLLSIRMVYWRSDAARAPA